jgi:hypothetical protein
MADVKTVDQLDPTTSVVAGNLVHVLVSDGMGGYLSRKADVAVLKPFVVATASTSLSIVAGHVAINAADFGPFYCTLTENSILDLPTNGVNGQSIEIDFIQDGTGSRTLDVSAFAIPVDATVPVQPTAASSRSVMAFRLCGTTWYVTSFLKFAS